jgi:hypothetical protein
MRHLWGNRMNCYKKRIALSVPQDGGVEEQREKFGSTGTYGLRA